MPTSTDKPKRPEIVLATWAGKTGAEHFGDRRYAPISACDSMWLSLRVVDDDSFGAFRLRQTISDIGLWIWWSTDSDSINVEFRGHAIHSATVDELERIVSELRRLNKRVPLRLHGEGYSSYVCRVLQAAGIKRRVEYSRGLGSSGDQYHSLQSCFRELTDEIVSRSGKVAA